MSILLEQHKNLSEEIFELKKKAEQNNGNKTIHNKLEAQKEECINIKKEIEAIKQEHEKITEKEEVLYFALQGKKAKLKDMKEEYIRKENEAQICMQESKMAMKEAVDRNEHLNAINQLEKMKNNLLKEFIGTAIRKRENPSQNANFLLQSSFRVLKLQLQDMEKDLLAVPINIFAHENSLIPQTPDFSESF